MTKLKELISKSNQNAEFVGNYDKNKELHKKLFLIASPITIASFVITLTAFILIGVFGSSLASIKANTPLLISMFVLMIVFSVVFGFGLYVLKQASSLHLEKPLEENKEEEMAEIVEKTKEK